jgi:chromosome segregation protein
MKIRQIELIGFKSFAEKTTLNFHEGITCIVGPNGCGKSNIVDAFRWVLGEQSAKSLRGEKMEEVIFQGSSTKKQKGLAEVTLYLSLTDGSQKESDNGTDSPSTDEVSVTRRLYRSGESEYLLNKNPCRLKDIRDLFLDTGLDVKSYFIVDQGRIAEIINSKPIDRRFLIEEVAGVMKYKVRKAEALSKLDSSKQNLQRINDILIEVKRQLNSLERQVKKAEKYKKLIEELKTIELRVAKKYHEEFLSTLNNLSIEIKKLKEEESSEKSELSRLENIVETKQISILEKEKILNDMEIKFYEKEKFVSETEKSIAVLKTNIENKKRDIIKLSKETEEIKKNIEVLIKRDHELLQLEGLLSSEIENYSSQLNEQKEFISDIEIEILDKETEIEDKRKALFTISDVINSRKNDLHKLQSSLDNINYKISIALKDIESIKSSTDKTIENIKNIEESIQNGEKELSKIMEDKEVLNSVIEKIKKDIENKKNLQNEEKQNLSSCLSRLNSLKEILIDKSLIDFTPEANKLISDLIDVEKNYETAIEASFSEKINALIVEDIDDLLKAINIIKDKKIGRTALLYKRKIDKKSHEHEMFSISHNKIVGKALDFLKYGDPTLKDVATNLLKNVYVVEDLASALEVLNLGFSENFSLVTLEGEFISNDGWCFVGKGTDILKKKRELKELQEEIDRKQKIIKEIEVELNTLIAELAAKKDLLKSKEITAIDIEKQLTVLSHSLKDFNDKIERNERRISFLNSEITLLSQEKYSIEELIRTKKNEIVELEQKRDDLNSETKKAQESVSNIKEKYEDFRTKIADLKLLIEKKRERLEATKREKRALHDIIEEHKRKLIIIEKEINDTEKIIDESLKENERLQDEIKKVVIDMDNLNYERNKLKDEIDSEKQDITSKNNLLRNIRARIDEISQKKAELNALIVENRLKIENIEKTIYQKYGINIKDINVDLSRFDTAEEESKIEELNTRLRDMGPVNLSMIEEYEELKNRFDFLTKQQQDLTRSIAELEEAISRIDSTTKRKLKEAYSSLREKFIEVFTSLFGGGKADLILTDEGNILESGLDIIAQPPGKKLQNINLLSGGEKALTSIAVLFAGFFIKPSPLCILDEADAPLDEPNTARFATMIKELSKSTQFVIITHNKTTMEIADYLYGITMEEPGSSKTISLQFSDATK